MIDQTHPVSLRSLVGRDELPETSSNKSMGISGTGGRVDDDDDDFEEDDDDSDDDDDDGSDGGAA